MHGASVNKKVLLLVIDPIETTQIRIWARSEFQERISCSTETIISATPKKIYIFAQHTPKQNNLRMVLLPHRNHKISIWNWFGFNLKNWLNPKKYRISIKTVKI